MVYIKLLLINESFDNYISKKMEYNMNIFFDIKNDVMVWRWINPCTIFAPFLCINSVICWRWIIPYPLFAQFSCIKKSYGLEIVLATIWIEKKTNNLDSCRGVHVHFSSCKIALAGSIWHFFIFSSIKNHWSLIKCRLLVNLLHYHLKLFKL